MRILRPCSPKKGNPQTAPWRLALVTVLQFVENLPDRQAAEMVRARLDWKYLLGLDLTDPGFDASVLSEFRARLIEGQAEHLLLEKMLALFQQKGWLKARGRQRTSRPTCWARSARLTACCVSGKRCAPPRVVWLLRDLIGRQGRELLDALFDPTALKSAPPDSCSGNLTTSVGTKFPAD